MSNSTQTRTSSTKITTRTRCTCEWSGCFEHDELLRLETNGLDGICALVAAWAREGGTGQQAAVASSDFEAFVAAHEWIDPLRMYRLGRDLCETFDRYRSEGAGTRTAFDTEVAIVRCKAATLRAHGDSAAARDLEHSLGEIVGWLEGRPPAPT